MSTALPGPPPVALDSTNSRAHRQQIAKSVNALIKKVFDNNTSTTQTIADLTQTVTDNNNTLSANLTSEAGVRASADGALGASITTINAALNGYTGSNAVATAVSSLSASVGNVSNTIGGAYSPSNTVASALTSLSTTVGGNSSSISTLLTTVGGYSSMWALQLDANGNVIGRIEMSGSGATSTFSVHANNFEVYNGSSSTPAFAISGGVAQLNVPLQTAAVATSHIQSNAVTNLVAAENGSGDVSITITTSGGPILVAGLISDVHTGDNYTITRNGTSVSGWSTSDLTPIHFVDNPGAGTWTYATSTGFGTAGASLSALEILR